MSCWKWMISILLPQQNLDYDLIYPISLNETCRRVLICTGMD
jgi:hypothetical protein